MTTSHQQMSPLKVRKDSILADLWAVKAKLNAQAGYDVKRLLENAAKTARLLRANGFRLPV
ncbi:MAG: hypothetical protein QM533_06515 [Cytophagales bacterium]|nr:hypothetical protein [Cytophagales bacterium]